MGGRNYKRPAVSPEKRDRAAYRAVFSDWEGGRVVFGEKDGRSKDGCKVKAL